MLISNEAVALRIPFAEAPESVLSLVAVAGSYIQVRDLEDITIYHIRGVAGIRVRLV